MYLKELVDVYDVCTIIMGLYIGDALTVYLTPAMSHADSKAIYMIHGNGLVSRMRLTTNFYPNRAYIRCEHATSISMWTRGDMLDVTSYTEEGGYNLSVYSVKDALYLLGGSATKGIPELPSYYGKYCVSYDRECDTGISGSRFLVTTDHYTPEKEVIRIESNTITVFLFVDGSISTLDERGCTPTHATIPVNLCLDIACGYDTLFCITIEGELWARGNNDFGQLGLGNDTRGTYLFQRIEGLPPVCAIRVGDRFAAALDIYNRLWVTGDNLHGQLGTGDRTRRTRFVRIEQLRDIVSVYCGDAIIIVTLRDDSRWACGANVGNRMHIDPCVLYATCFVRLNWEPPLEALHKKRRLAVL